jgi:MFS family permease
VNEPSRYRDAFAVREFRAIFLAHVISMAGTIVAQLALTVLVYERTGSALLSALTFATGFLPFLIAGTLLSAVVERVPTRRLLVTCNLLSGTFALAMALPAAPVAALLILNFLLGMVQPLFTGARSATLRDVLTGGAYISGRSVIRLVVQGAQLGGMALSGLLLTVVAPRDLLLGNALSFGVSALVLRLGTRERRLAPEKPETAARPSLARDSLAGIGKVFAIAPLRRLILFVWADAALAVAPEGLMVPYATNRFGGTISAGLLLTAIPLGTFSGELLTNCKASPARQISLIRPAVAVSFTPMLLFVAKPGLALALVVLFVSGLGAAATLGLDRLTVEYTPPDLLPRTLSLQAAGVMFWQGIGFAAAGAAAELVSPSVVITASAALGLLTVAAYAVASRTPRPQLAPTIAS